MSLSKQLVLPDQSIGSFKVPPWQLEPLQAAHWSKCDLFASLALLVPDTLLLSRTFR
jgi:hypothetical protein